MARTKRAAPEVNAGSMADIAFLLLIFFLVTATIASDKGIAVILPPKKVDKTEIKINQRNIYNVLINSQDAMLIDDQPANLSQVKDLVKKFVLNNGANPDLSDSPDKAVISVKTDRGTSYKMYIDVVDEIKEAYTEMRAAHLKMPVEEYVNLDEKNAADKEKLDKAKEAIPYQVSDAEPTKI